ncbi:MAG TPA: hypothetical protein VG222_01980 [Vicinamibacterales bacterium]|nr:hypothetical protein [Vicinamibacterales bacterium]
MRSLLSIFIALVLISPSLRAIRPDVIRSISAIPPHLAGRFREPTGFQQAASGQYFVFDRRSHVVFGIDEQQTSSWEIVHIGAEPGRIIDPTAFSLEPGGTFAVADAPNNQERIQIFSPVGVRIGGFMLPGRAKRRVVFENLVLSGIGTLQYTGTSILMSQPESGALISEYTPQGGLSRTFGQLRHTGHEDDRELHLTLNSGIPLVDPTGGFFFVFQTGEPLLQKYDRAGTLIYERRIQGREIDDLINQLPTIWPQRQTSEGELPLVRPTVRSAAVDASGRLWVAFVVPYVYVFDPDGDKVRALQLRAAGVVAPSSLSFNNKGRLLVTPGLYEFDTRAGGAGLAGGT